MNIRNSRDEADKPSYGWALAVGAGAMVFFVMNLTGTNTNIAAVKAAGALTLILGVMFDWALTGRDPATRIEEILKPKKLFSYDQMLGVSTGRPKSFSLAVNAMFAPGKLQSYEERFGLKPYDLTGLRATVEGFGPKKLTSYKQLFSTSYT